MKFKIKNSRFPEGKSSTSYGAGKIQNLKSSITNPQSSMSKGLTLIEVMVVVAILSIITSTLFSVFQGSLLSQRRGTNKALVYSEARAALDMMSREIEKAFVDERIDAHYELWDVDSTYRHVNDSNVGDELYFIIPNDEGDLCEVGYWLQGVSGDEGDTVMRHYTSDTTDFDFNTRHGNQDSNPLIGHVSNLKFEYWDEGFLQFVKPLPSPLEGYALPKAVKITLVLEYPIEREEIRHDTFITVVNIPGSGQ